MERQHLFFVDRWPETGFLRDTWLQSQIWEKNPVSWSSRVVARNRVFARYLVTVADLGEKPGFFGLAGGAETLRCCIPPTKNVKYPKHGL